MDRCPYAVRLVTSPRRFDYRVHGRRETLVIRRDDPTRGATTPRDGEVLGYGQSVTLAEARLLLAHARHSVGQAERPEEAEALTFGA